MSTRNESRIVVINQHGDNRGDEAAMRAMISQLARLYPDDSFTVIHQFADAHSEVEVGHPVEYLPMRLPLAEAARLALYGLLIAIRLPIDRLLGPIGLSTVKAYRAARLVVSAPGGPYFGDFYAGHELVHWFYVWLASLMKKRLFLYAPSVGPFRNRILNPVRRRGFGKFQSVAVRDNVSAQYLKMLMGSEFPFETTADSALQEDFQQERREREPGENLHLVVAVRDPGRPSRDAHDDTVVKAIHSVCSAHSTDITFLPQLHGRRKDKPYLMDIANRVTNAASKTVADDLELDSDSHRRIVASADLVIAGRYHPAVFAVAAAVPVIVIAYEHKSEGLAQMAGIEQWCVDVGSVAESDLGSLAISALEARDEIISTLSNTRVQLQQAARRSSAMAAEVAREQ